MLSSYKIRDEDFITDMNQLPRCICNPIARVASFLSVSAASPHDWLFTPQESQNLLLCLNVSHGFYLNTSSLECRNCIL